MMDGNRVCGIIAVVAIIVIIPAGAYPGRGMKPAWDGKSAKRGTSGRAPCATGVVQIRGRQPG